MINLKKKHLDKIKQALAIKLNDVSRNTKTYIKNLQKAIEKVSVSKGFFASIGVLYSPSPFSVSEGF